MKELKEKEIKLRNYIKSLKSVIVAFSGGIDSTLLLKISLEELGKNNVLAVIGRSPTYPSREIDFAQSMADKLKAPNITIDTDELTDNNYRANPVERCFYCKTELFSKLKGIAKEKDLSTVIDGSNADDLSDYRPGSKAAEKHGVISPIQKSGLNKSDVRDLAKKIGLENWDKPSMACLASRFPYGQEINIGKLKKIEKAEQFLQDLGIEQVRVRLDNDTARLEVLVQEFARIVKHSQEITSYLKELGFIYITLDLEGYKSGSLNRELETKDERLEGKEKSNNLRPKIKSQISKEEELNYA